MWGCSLFTGDNKAGFEGDETLAAAGFAGEVITLGAPNRLGVTGAAALPFVGDEDARVRLATGVDGRNGLNLKRASSCAGLVEVEAAGREGEALKSGLRAGDAPAR